MNQEILLSPDELTAKLHEGGWFIYGGRDVVKIDGNYTRYSIDKVCIEKVYFDEKAVCTLELYAGAYKLATEFENIALVNPHTIEIRRPYIRRDVIKKSLGGGYKDVPYLGKAVVLQHKALAYKAINDNELLKEKNQKRDKEIIEANQKKFLDALNAALVGKTNARVELVNESIQIQFDDGSNVTLLEESWYPLWQRVTIHSSPA